MEIAALKSQVSILERTQSTTIQSTLSNEMMRLETSLLKPCLHDFRVQISQLSEQLKSYSDHQMPVVKEDNSGLVDTQARQHHTSTPCATMDNLHRGNRDKGTTQGRSQARKVEVKRKRKSSYAARDTLLMEFHQGKSRGDHFKPDGSVGGEALSQSSTENLSTPCDVDLTQHSPSGCSQIISQNVQKLKHCTTCTSTSQTVPQQTPQASLSPSHGPAAKRKRATSRVSRQKNISTNHKRKVIATPKATRRSQRLGKLLLHATPVKLTQEEEVVGKGCSRDEGECVDHTRQKSVDKQSTAKCGNGRDAGDNGDGDSGNGDGGDNGRSGDVLEDWLDFQPPQVTPQSVDIKPASSQVGDHVSHHTHTHDLYNALNSSDTGNTIPAQQ